MPSPSTPDRSRILPKSRGIRPNTKQPRQLAELHRSPLIYDLLIPPTAIRNSKRFRSRLHTRQAEREQRECSPFRFFSIRRALCLVSCMDRIAMRPDNPNFKLTSV
ncbi:hypothetical protein AVEN_70746-1 [Araneus ventricosus]|uniref:Uncharacterized protein n=1 Tax=Araneus ventricosus TaxID=182803 RepID=A0A4Y2WBH7_ARAVE|nr:hypothetical protein AVEN_70746-1 [Araneus ventricosus]